MMVVRMMKREGGCGRRMGRKKGVDQDKGSETWHEERCHFEFSRARIAIEAFISSRVFGLLTMISHMETSFQGGCESVEIVRFFGGGLGGGLWENAGTPFVCRGFWGLAQAVL